MPQTQSTFPNSERTNYVKLLANMTTRIQEARERPGVALYKTEEELDSVPVKLIDWITADEIQAS
ncbi:uncharacterized protein BO66DRAFT_442965 [Aspergillus aculeatinus CBS 121060]|uniref:Uncharacterized protein n=1 Tax=Aspergillus aculeatinus CBS 121060 TaxID=1448322 RepID=A0ACD1GW33_9EURO|nr:hypothetical protein BO66DRAFT_442965 [Aspergillus aculeatinus CBS 121060]RAH65559.1 hypothetical protein BO66DRAFT_442965 [Aspergillus aculeatinus CBS 121060]